MMKVEPTGVVMIGTCEIQTEFCTAHAPAPITAVWTSPGRRQVDVCHACLDYMVRDGRWEVSGARIRRRADLVVVDSGNNPVLVVEVKSSHRSSPATPEWAQLIRRNLRAHIGIPEARYFMLAVVPGPFFLWCEGESLELDAAPDFEFDISPVIVRYVEEQSSALPEAWRRDEEAVGHWLQDLVQGRATTPDPWLLKSGLAQALAGGRVVREYER